MTPLTGFGRFVQSGGSPVSQSCASRSTFFLLRLTKVHSTRKDRKLRNMLGGANMTSNTEKYRMCLGRMILDV